MAEKRTCPKCGAEMPRDALAGHCPRCLARIVFGGAEEPELNHQEQRSEVGSQGSEPTGQQESELVGEPRGQRIGRYKLLERIGEGGFGTVYMAEQVEPVQRKVALKIVKAGMDTREVIARFEAERQALALMDHPNIARVLDVGATESGRPYFVMELVHGISITAYCDRNHLSTNERLRLFIKVCQAVQHAHQKGIIHRDIKPSNVLVTLHDGEPIPKVIDFGIAKALGHRLTEKTLFTGFAHLLGTPAYMSPEQAELSGLDIDTRSDIYSLGVLLYELLTSVTPFDKETFGKAALEEIRRMIRETEPPKPSTRLQTLGGKVTEIAKQRHTEPTALRRLVRGDLDWIVMRCLEKDRQRRYETATTLALDVEHHLNQEPVTAGPPSALYRARKFVIRHKAPLATAAALIALLVAGVVVSVGQAFRAKRAEKRALIEASTSSQVAGFLREMLEGVGPSVALGRDTKLVREILDKTAERIGKELNGQPAVEAEIRKTIGEVYRTLGLYDKAEAMQRQALVIRKRLFGEQHPKVAESLNGLANALWSEGKAAEAEKLNRQAMEIQRRVLGAQAPDVALSLNFLALALRDEGRLPEAESLMRQAVAIHTNALGPAHADLANSMNNLASVLWRASKLADAESWQRSALAMQRRLFGIKHPDVAISINNLSTLLRDEGKLEEAEEMEREAIAMQRELLGNDHPELAISLNNLANVLQDRGKLAEAEATIQDSLGILRKALGERHPQVATALGNLAVVRFRQGKLAEAVAAQRDALEMDIALLGNEHLDVARAQNNLSIMLRDEGKLSEADTVLRKALATRRRLLGNTNAETAVSINNLASLLWKQVKLAEAESTQREALDIQRALLGNRHPDLAVSINNLGTILEDQGKFAEAERTHLEALAMRTNVFGAEHADVAGSLHNLARVLCDEGRYAEAERLHQQALDMRRKLLGLEHPQVAQSLHGLASVLCAEAKLTESESNYVQALTIRTNRLGREHPDVAQSLQGLAIVRREQGRLQDAESLCRQATEMRRKVLGNDHPHVATSLEELAVVLLRENQPTQAEPLARECLTIRESRLPDDWRTYSAKAVLGASLLAQNKYADAEPLMVSGCQGMLDRRARIPSDMKPRVKEALGQLEQLFEATNRGGQAVEWKKKETEL